MKKSNQRKKLKKTSFSKMVAVMHKLRAPGGCPWDRKQTHKSLLRYLKEESNELFRAVRKKDRENIKEELGDVLLQVLFHSEIAAEKGHFDIYDVIHTLRMKLVRRHPHVFGKDREKLTARQVKQRWGDLKKKEKRLRRGY